MSTLTGLISSGGGGSIDQDNYFYFIDQSKTFVAPFSGEIDVYCIGAGGSGGIAFNAGGTGGGAGGTAIKKDLAVTYGDTFTVVIGSGGSSVSSDNVAVPGVSGGQTTVNSNDVTCALTANGGGAGQTDGTASTGGTGSGGDLNFSGGVSGTALNYAGHYTGGGAVGLNQNGYSSGSITGDPNASNITLATTGGAGLGGGSKDIPNTTSNSAVRPSRTSGGGGGLSEGGNPINTNSASNVSSLVSQGGFGFIDSSRASTSAVYLFGRGLGGPGLSEDGTASGLIPTNNQTPSDAEIGGGGGGIVRLGEVASDGGAFGGGGAFRPGGNGYNANAVAGEGGYGGGGGGSNWKSGTGGNGCVIFIYNSVS